VGWRCFVNFAVSNAITLLTDGLPALPSEQFMELFVTFCAQHLKLAYDTIKLYLCAVKHRYIENGYGDIFSNMCRLKLTLRGIRKVHANPKRHRLPLTAPMLHKIGVHLSHSTVLGPYEDMLLWTALCVGFFGALRCGEFTEGHLTVGDIMFSHDKALDKQYVSLNLKGSKTDPYRQGCTIFLFHTGQVLCPYTALVKYFNAYIVGKKTMDQSLFCHERGDVMTRGSFIKNLHVVLEAVNISTKGIMGHSLRKGLATTAAGADIQDNLISVMGRWASDCYKLYISTPLSSIARAQQVIASQGMSD
jgi:hypothetical protein